MKPQRVTRRNGTVEVHRVADGFKRWLVLAQRKRDHAKIVQAHREVGPKRAEIPRCKRATELYRLAGDGERVLAMPQHVQRGPEVVKLSAKAGWNSSGLRAASARRNSTASRVAASACSLWPNALFRYTQTCSPAEGDPRRRTYSDRGRRLSTHMAGSRLFKSIAPTTTGRARSASAAERPDHVSLVAGVQDPESHSRTSTCRTALLFTSAMPLRTLEPRGSPAYLLASCVEFEGRLAQVKMSSGRNADTRTLGTSTSSLIARSTATLQIAYACWRLKPRSWTR